jgi:tetratricopeptide (TPR) repeat protein
MRIHLCLAVLALLATASPASAASPKAKEDCNRRIEAAIRIRACTEIIDDRSESPSNRATAYSRRGLAYASRRDLDRAIADYGQAIQLKPDFAEAYNSRGIAYLSKGEPDRAIPDFDSAIRLSPDREVIYNSRGFAYLRKREYDRAIADFSQAIKLKADYAVPYSNRGAAYREKGQLERALADTEKAIRLRPDFARAYLNRGLTHAKKRDHQRAIADLSEAIRLDPNDPEYYEARAASHEAAGQIDLAKADYRTAVDLLPRRPAGQEAQSSARSALARLEGRDPAPQTNKVGPAPRTGALGRRVALVIGNSRYTNSPLLKNPRPDAQAIAAAFRRLGFAEVVERYDLPLRELADEFKSFGDLSAGADWAVVYFAGHGIEVAGVNYLLPVDVKLERAAHVEDEGFPLERVLAKVEPARQLRLVILDACRNNPFASRMATARGSRAIGRGLSRIEPTGGVLVAYAARAGSTADDGDDQHSPFAAAFLEHVEQRLELRLFFGKVRDTCSPAPATSRSPSPTARCPARSSISSLNAAAAEPVRRPSRQRPWSPDTPRGRSGPTRGRCPTA